MSLKETISNDVKTAMKAREQKKLTTLRGIMAEIKKIEIDTRKELTDSDVLSVLQKEVKKRKDALVYAVEGKRQDLIDENNAELEILQAYMGEQFEGAKLRELIEKLITSGANNLGAVMGSLNKDYKGQFDGKEASSIAKELLG